MARKQIKRRHTLKHWQILQKQHPYLFWSSIFFFVIVLIVLLITVKLNKHKPVVKPASVIAAAAKKQDVPIYLFALGNVTPLYTVTVRTQINGQLQKLLFTEGQMVKTGQWIAQIDPRPYEAQLEQYQGQLKRDQALLDNARIDLKRYQTLWKQDAISQQTLATQLSLVKQYEGDVETDKGLIAATKVNLIYCRITSPVNGRIGIRLVDPGNFVQTTDVNGIVIITTLDPISVLFTLPEDDIQQVLSQVAANKQLMAEAYDRQQQHRLATGKLLALDSQVNTSTGTIKLRALFNNKNNELFPNQFVNIKLLVDTVRQAIIVPTAAIQHGDQGNYVYLVRPNHTVTVKPINTGAVSDEYTVIKTGLQENDLVIVGGADKLTDGSVIRIKNKQTLDTSKKT